jgi:hypothetical protein
LHDGLDDGGYIPIITASIIWIVGDIYSLAYFNNSYNFSALKNADHRILEVIVKRKKQKIEEEMLQIKRLLDNGILTEDEYNQKMKPLKEKYL